MPENCLTMVSWADTSPFCARTISSRSNSIIQYAIVRIRVTGFCSHWTATIRYHRMEEIWGKKEVMNSGAEPPLPLRSPAPRPRRSLLRSQERGAQLGGVVPDLLLFSRSRAGWFQELLQLDVELVVDI